jgi:glyoxylase-like metal-dependent hydrolase (beta-lactamase superfamily II)/rhodanese-related sulfurtransferase
MKIEQIYTGCLAEAAYYIESEGEVAIIDPLREVKPYIEKAEKQGDTIKYIFETHFHADFVSGHVDLSKKTGAPIIFGPTALKTGFDATFATDGQVFKLGKVTLKVLHTPGHTMESICLLLIDENGKETALFSGDTLFLGDVGRPDLAQHVIADLTEDKLAGHLFDSLRNKIMPLSDDIIVYPAHGAGSACGKNLSKETSGTLGEQKKTNYALNPNLTKEAFKKELLKGLVTPPSYFPKNVLMNINGYDSIDEVVERGTKAKSARVFEVMAQEKAALILDTRNPNIFAKGFIPNSINIGIDGNFAVWVGTLIPDIKQEILLITEQGREEEVVIRLARVGYDNTIGYLEGGFEAWKNAGKDIETIETIDVEDLATLASTQEIHLIDARKESEYKSEHVIEAINMPLDFINNNMAMIDKKKTYHVHCASGYRSMIFISILKARGFDNLINVNGGFNALKASEKFEVSAFVCPTTML